MSIYAYSGVAIPISTITGNVLNNDFRSSGSTTITITDNGILYGFLATINIFTNASNVGAKVIMRLLRNGVQLTSSTINTTDFRTEGIILLENLGQLTGTELLSGDEFELNWTSSAFTSGAGTFQGDATMFALVKNTGKQYEGY